MAPRPLRFGCGHWQHATLHVTRQYCHRSKRSLRANLLTTTHEKGREARCKRLQLPFNDFGGTGVAVSSLDVCSLPWEPSVNAKRMRTTAFRITRPDNKQQIVTSQYQAQFARKDYMK